MIPQSRKYHVILVHSKELAATHEALRTLAQCVLPPDQIIIIDHGETPLRAAGIRSAAVYRPSHNTGYAGGVNSGLGVLLTRGVRGHDVVIVMNNDVTVYPDTFQELRRWWDAHRGEALMGAVTEEASGTVRGQSYVNLLTGRAQLFGRKPRYALPYIHGAFFAAPYAVFMSTRGLPENYFLYWEDAAFSRRVQALRIPLLTAGGVRVAHRARASTPPSAQLYYLVRNGALFLERETPRLWRLYWWIANRLRLLYHSLNPQSQPLVRRALRDAARQLTGPLVP